MKRIWEIHKDFSLAIGDGIDIDSTYIGSVGTIPDGVRFTKSERDNYINRAALKVYDDVLKNTISLPKDVKSGTLENIFPNVIRTVEPSTYTQLTGGRFRLSFDMQYDKNTNINFKVAALLRANGYLATYAGLVPIPIRSGSEVNRFANIRNSNRKDIFLYNEYSGADDFTWASSESARYLKLMFYNPDLVEDNINGGTRQFDDTTDTIYLTYLPYPIDISELNVTDFYYFEDSMYMLLLQFASLYAMIDSQDFDLPERAMPLLFGGDPQRRR
jgi:hypothetical protein